MLMSKQLCIKITSAASVTRIIIIAEPELVFHGLTKLWPFGTKHKQCTLESAIRSHNIYKQIYVCKTASCICVQHYYQFVFDGEKGKIWPLQTIPGDANI